jgi:putative ABC transport system permease protein
MRAEMAKLAPGRLAVTEMQTMDTTVDRAESGTRFQFLLMGVFAAIAALLAAVGLYGVLSGVVRQRMPEIGVRMALGATPAGIFKMVVGRGLALSAVGVAGGFMAALALTRAMRSMLVGVTATDPATFAAMIALFFLVAAVASWAPARRAAGLDPNRMLRME